MLREPPFSLVKPSAYDIELIGEEGEQSGDAVKEDGGNPGLANGCLYIKKMSEKS